MSKEQKDEVVDALKTTIEALQIKNEALMVKIEALELMNKNLHFLREVVEQNGSPVSTISANGHKPEMVTEEMEEEEEDEDGEDEQETDRPAGKKRGRKPKPTSDEITKLQTPLDKSLREMLKGERYNKATFRALTGIMLCLFENKNATVTMLHEYIGGARVTVVRHTASLKRMGLIRYEGSRKRGHYAMTDKGRSLFNDLRSSN